MKLVTIDPRRIELADYGDLHLAPRPGTNAAVLLGLAHVIEPRRLRATTSSSTARTEGFDAVPRAAAGLHARGRRGDQRRARRRTSSAAAHIYGEAENACFSWGLGVTEHKYGSEVVQLICNLALMTGKIGRPGSALMPLRGQNNVQGSSDMGALPDTYTAYRSVGDEDVARSFEERLGRRRSRASTGYKIPEMFDAAVAGDLKAMYIFGEDVAQTDPDTAHVVQRARGPRVPGLPGHLRDRDHEVRRRDPAGLVLPREDGARSPTPSAGFSSSSRRSIRPARRRPTSRSSPTVSRALGHETGWNDPEDAMARSRR